MPATDLIIEEEITEVSGCSKWEFVDTTPLYNDPTAPGGYGAPNTESSAITSATISIYKYGETVPYIFTFTIAANVITACTVTSPAGVVTNILADLTSTVFPFTVADPFVIIADWLGFGTDSTFVSGAFYTEYNVTDGTYNYTTSSDDLMTCATDCCITNMQAGLDARSKKCKKKEMNAVMMARIWIDAATWAMEDGDVDKAQANLLYAQSLCSNGCVNC